MTNIRPVEKSRQHLYTHQNGQTIKPATMHRGLATIYFILCGLMIGLPFAFDKLFALSWFAFSLLPYLARNLSLSSFFIGCCLNAVIGYSLASYWAINFFLLQGNSYLKAAVLCISLWIYISIIFALWLSLYKVLCYFTHSVLARLGIFVLVLSGHFLLTPSPFPITPAVTQGAWQSAIKLSVFGGEIGLMLIMLINSAVVALFIHRTQIIASYLGLLVGLFFFAHYLCQDQQQPKQSITLGWVQPNAPPGVKPWPATASVANPIELQLSRAIATKADVIIWPESGRQEFLDNHRFIAQAKALADQTHTSLVIQDHTRAEQAHRNALLHIQPQQAAQYYFKQRLIPFGEYQPLPNSLNKLLDLPVRHQLQPGDADNDFHTPEFRWRSRICYELLFSKIFTTDVEDIDFITLSSNQTWFASKAQQQLIKTETQIRAIESKRMILHVTNAGPSWLFNASGELVAQSPANTQGAFFFTTEI